MFADPDAYRAYMREWMKRDRAADPEKHRARARARYARKREMILAQVKASNERRRDSIIEKKRVSYHSQSPEERRRRLLASRYGMTPDDYVDLMAAQQGRCAICQESHDLLDVDHDHLSGEVRGLLCQLCNKALGLFREDPDRLSAAVRYLKGGKK